MSKHRLPMFSHANRKLESSLNSGRKPLHQILKPHLEETIHSNCKIMTHCRACTLDSGFNRIAWKGRRARQTVPSVALAVTRLAMSMVAGRA